MSTAGAYGTSGKKSRIGESPQETPAKNPQLRKVSRKLRQQVPACGNLPGVSGEVSAMQESVPDVPAYLPYDVSLFRILFHRVHKSARNPCQGSMRIN